jgi:hypothetical protein
MAKCVIHQQPHGPRSDTLGTLCACMRQRHSVLPVRLEERWTPQQESATHAMSGKASNELRVGISKRGEL